MKHEREVLEALSKLRAESGRAEKIAAEGALAAGAARLLAVVENYVFPRGLLAKMFGFRAAEYFQL